MTKSTHNHFCNIHRGMWRCDPGTRIQTRDEMRALVGKDVWDDPYYTRCEDKNGTFLRVKPCPQCA